MPDLMDPDSLVDDETEGVGEPEEYVLLDGDTLMSKVTLATHTELGDAWVTFGVQTRVMSGEDEAHAFNRLATITTTRAIDTTRAVEVSVAEEVAERREIARANRITPAGR